MKHLKLILVGLFFIPTLFLTSCDKGEELKDDVVPTFTTLKNYMTTNSLDLPNVIKNSKDQKFVAGAPATADLAAFLAKYYIIDIRRATDFANGHIQGAKNVAFPNILDEIEKSGSKPILVVCYTGQTACYATALMRMYGKEETQALKWGMSGWNSATAGSWNNNIGDIAKDAPNWAYDAAPANLSFEDPKLSNLTTQGKALLKERVKEVVNQGFKTVKNSDVLNAPSNYFINNFFSTTDYTGFGHIKGAHRILPLTAESNINNLDPSKKIVTYCYTGQTSAIVTAWLRVLGYDAYSLTFGMNGLYHSNSAWKTNQWGVGSSVPKDLPIVK